MKRTFFRNSIIFSILIIFVVTFMSIGYSVLTKDVSISSNITFYQTGLLRSNSGTPSKFLGCDNIPSSSVKKLYFRASFSDTAVATCDVSNAQDGTVMAYLKSNGTVYVVADSGVVYANTATKFSNLVNCSYISFVDTNGYPRFNTSRLTNMYGMFQNLCSDSTCSMAKLDLTSFNTSKVQTMVTAFSGASNVQEIDVSNWDTSSCYAMDGLFYNCKKITSLNLSSWDTSKVYSMNGMFEYAEILRNVYVSSLWSVEKIGQPDTSHQNLCNNPDNNSAGVCAAQNMFWQSRLSGDHDYEPCWASVDPVLDRPNHAKIDGGTSDPGCLDDVANMPEENIRGLLRSNSGTPSKFLGCDNIPSSSVKKIYFRASFSDTAVATCDVSNAQDGTVMAYLKSNGTVFVVADSGVVYSNKATKFSNLVNCNLISFVDTNGYLRFNTSKLRNMYGMFQNLCSDSTCSMEKLDLTSFDTSKVQTMVNAFVNAKNVNDIDVSNWDTSSCFAMDSAFANCEKITSLNLSTWDTSKVYSMSAMFLNTNLLRHVYVSDLWSVAKIGQPDSAHTSLCNDSTNGVCSAFEMFTRSSLNGAHPYSPCWAPSIDPVLDNYENKGNYARIDGGSATPGCLDNVTNMPTN